VVGRGMIITLNRNAWEAVSKLKSPPEARPLENAGAFHLGLAMIVLVHMYSVGIQVTAVMNGGYP
jgi:hypothetical protein